ncbi:MAG: GTP 3',8-cyclase MoaA [Acidobacteriota bacterium]|nr:GTP 3',8-cyclase MoaA [Acidobacteriota bacterium]
MPGKISSHIAQVLDTFERPMRSLRVSVTDRCNLRCLYCMPEDDYVWVEREEILTFEEIVAAAEIFTSLGVRRLRITGGEPLLRHNLAVLIEKLAQNPRLEDIALTTNGIMLGRMARPLRDAGLNRVTVSLDTLDPGRFRSLTKSGAHSAVIEGIREALKSGFECVKINAVLMRGFNDDEIPALLEFSRHEGAEIRFIEYMDVGGATRWSMNGVVTRDEILAIIERRFGQATPVHDAADRRAGGVAKAPADRFRLADGTVFGIISSTSLPFCGSCDRSRLTPDGVWLLCLYARDGINLKALLRGGTPAGEIAQTIEKTWKLRSDRGAEERKLAPNRGALFQAEELRKDLHLEMHTRGG